MKKGVLIIFSNDEDNIDKSQFVNLLSHKDVQLCFVNNGSKDNTLDLLETIKSEVKTPISILDIKKNKGTIAAVKAGVRFLFSTENLNCILYLKLEILSSILDLKKQIEVFKKIDDQFNAKNTPKNRRKILQKVVSFNDLLCL